MVCEHLAPLENALLAAGFRVVFRGEAWSLQCREWVYFDCVLDREALRRRFLFAPIVVDHEHVGTHDGQEAGFICTNCRDAVIGVHPHFAADARVFG